MLNTIYKKIEKRERLSVSDAVLLATQGDFLTIGQMADALCKEKNGKKAAYLVDRNINYTNVCAARCNFCAFYRPLDHKDQYDLSLDQISGKIEETLKMGGKRILMQGGLHPEHTIETYEKLVSGIKSRHAIHVHAFSPPEVHHVSTKAGITYDETFKRLKAAGLDSMPGGGAEILVEPVRSQIMTGKCSGEQWIAVMKAAHENGIKTTATMMMGHIESWEDRFKHMEMLRDLQDQTQGFLSFIPWTFQPENTPMHPKIKRNTNVKLATAFEYLKTLAIARLFLDNFQHIQVSLLTQGLKVAQIGLSFGSDDLGSWLIEENVVRMAGRDQEIGLEKEKMASIIREAGLIPYERDTFYRAMH